MKVLLLLFLLCCAAFIPVAYIVSRVPEVYFFIFEHQKWRQWRYWVQHSHLFRFDYKYGRDYVFKTSDDKFHAVIWHDGTCSIHNQETGDCLSSFCTKHSLKMKNLLIQNNYEQIRLNGR